LRRSWTLQISSRLSVSTMCVLRRPWRHRLRTLRRLALAASLPLLLTCDLCAAMLQVFNLPAVLCLTIGTCIGLCMWLALLVAGLGALRIWVPPAAAAAAASHMASSNTTGEARILVSTVCNLQLTASSAWRCLLASALSALASLCVLCIIILSHVAALHPLVLCVPFAIILVALL